MRTFEEYFRSAIRAAAITPRPLQPGECQSTSAKRCHLCYAVDLTYEAEVRLKGKALQEFWRQVSRSPLAPLIASPLGRAYRTVTKRKAFHRTDSVILGLIDPSEDGPETSFNVVRCAIEPEGHARIYAAVQAAMSKPHARSLAGSLNYVVIKGSYSEFTIIFSVSEVSASVVKAANTLSKSLSRSFPQVVGLFLFEDRSRGRYYLGTSNPRVKQVFRKVYGKNEIYQQIAGRSFLYSPLSFSQVNQSIAETMVGKTDDLLDLKKNQTLYDLYCGYGLFSLCLAGKAGQVVGVEISTESVASAIANARRNSVKNSRFFRSDITAQTVQRIMMNATNSDVVLLDPPRKGTAPGVIEAIAAKSPQRVLHIFCNIDLMPAELSRWQSCGYKVACAVPLDLFPGTSAVETMVVLAR